MLNCTETSKLCSPQIYSTVWTGRPVEMHHDSFLAKEPPGHSGECAPALPAPDMGSVSLGTQGSGHTREPICAAV